MSFFMVWLVCWLLRACVRYLLLKSDCFPWMAPKQAYRHLLGGVDARLQLCHLELEDAGLVQLLGRQRLGQFQRGLGLLVSAQLQEITLGKVRDEFFELTRLVAERLGGKRESHEQAQEEESWNECSHCVSWLFRSSCKVSCVETSCFRTRFSC